MNNMWHPIMRKAIAKAALALFSLGPSTAALAQTPALTPDPNAWRPVVYADLQLPGPDTKPFAAIWADRISANNAAYKAMGDTRYVVANAPVTESHFVIRSPIKTVVLSVLNTATGCKIIGADAPGNATLKRCPMRLAIYQSGNSTISDAGNGCFVEYGPAPANVSIDTQRNAAYAAYDFSARTIRTGVFLGRKAIDECVLKVPLTSTN